jgi:hypothetical protein
MKDWKVRQALFHRTTLLDDVFQEGEILITTDIPIVPEVVRYFTTEMGGTLVYPAKSYAVALVYAHLLSKYFSEQMLTALSDPLLLYGNDRFFVPLDRDRAVYEETIRTLSIDETWDVEASPFSQVQATVAYFKREFLLV